MDSGLGLVIDLVMVIGIAVVFFVDVVLVVDPELMALEVTDVEADAVTVVAASVEEIISASEAYFVVGFRIEELHLVVSYVVVDLSVFGVTLSECDFGVVAFRFVAKFKYIWLASSDSSAN